MSEAPKIEVATEPEEAERSNVTQLYPGVPRVRRVPPLSDSEILELRQFMEEFRRIKTSCPVAQRILAD